MIEILKMLKFVNKKIIFLGITNNNKFTLNFIKTHKYKQNLFKIPLIIK